MQEIQINFCHFTNSANESALPYLSLSLSLSVKKARSRIYLILKHLLQKAKYVCYFNTPKPVAHWDATNFQLNSQLESKKLFT